MGFVGAGWACAVTRERVNATITVKLMIRLLFIFLTSF